MKDDRAVEKTQMVSHAWTNKEITLLRRVRRSEQFEVQSLLSFLFSVLSPSHPTLCHPFSASLPPLLTLLHPASLLIPSHSPVEVPQLKTGGVFADTLCSSLDFSASHEDTNTTPPHLVLPVHGHKTKRNRARSVGNHGGDGSGTTDVYPTQLKSTRTQTFDPRNALRPFFDANYMTLTKKTKTD